MRSPLPFHSRAYREAELRGMRIGILGKRRAWCGDCGDARRCRARRKITRERGFTVEPFRLDDSLARLICGVFFGPVIGNLICRSVPATKIKSARCCASISRARRLEIQLPSSVTEPARIGIFSAPIFCAKCKTRHSALACSTSPAFVTARGNYLPGTGYRDTMRFSQWLNLTGFPARPSLRVSNDGLPIGVQVIGRPFEDELVLAVAKPSSNHSAPGKHPHCKFREQTASMPLLRFLWSTRGWVRGLRRKIPCLWRLWTRASS